MERCWAQFPIFLLRVCSVLPAGSCFSLRRLKLRVLLQKWDGTTTFWSEISLKTELHVARDCAPPPLGGSSSAAPRPEAHKCQMGPAFLTRQGATQEPPERKATPGVAITHILCGLVERGPETQVCQSLAPTTCCSQRQILVLMHHWRFCMRIKVWFIKQIKFQPRVRSSPAFFYLCGAVKWCLMHLQLNKAARLGKHGNKGSWKCADHSSKSLCRRMHIVGNWVYEK